MAGHLTFSCKMLQDTESSPNIGAGRWNNTRRRAVRPWAWRPASLAFRVRPSVLGSLLLASCDASSNSWFFFRFLKDVRFSFLFLEKIPTVLCQYFLTQNNSVSIWKGLQRSTCLLVSKLQRMKELCGKHIKTRVLRPHFWRFWFSISGVRSRWFSF